MMFCPSAKNCSLPLFSSVSCSASIPLIISQKVTFYLQPDNIIIWTWHRSPVCGFLILCLFCIRCMCVCECRSCGIQFGEPRWLPVSTEPNVNFLSAFTSWYLRFGTRSRSWAFLALAVITMYPDPHKIPMGSSIQSAPPSLPVQSLGGCTLTWHYR